MNHFHILKQKLLSETEGTDGSLRSHSCAFGGGSSLRKDDEDERTSMLREAPDIELAIVVAVDENDAIGFGQHLLCHLPNDLKYFKHLTTGHSIIMGRLTYQSLPVQPLPHRHNIVLSNNIHYKPRGASKANSIKQALDLAQDDTQIFFVGGDSIYKQAFLFVDTLYVTLIHHRFPRADAYFDGHHSTQFTEVNRIFNEQDEKNPYPHSFITYVRNSLITPSERRSQVKPGDDEELADQSTIPAAGTSDTTTLIGDPSLHAQDDGVGIGRPQGYAPTT